MADGSRQNIRSYLVFGTVQRFPLSLNTVSVFSSVFSLKLPRPPWNQGKNIWTNQSRRTIGFEISSNLLILITTPLYPCSGFITGQVLLNSIPEFPIFPFRVLFLKLSNAICHYDCKVN